MLQNDDKIGIIIARRTTERRHARQGHAILKMTKIDAPHCQVMCQIDGAPWIDQSAVLTEIGEVLTYGTVVILTYYRPEQTQVPDGVVTGARNCLTQFWKSSAGIGLAMK